MPTPKTIGQRIRFARVSAGFSQEDVGDALGLTRSSVSLWEKDRSVPSREHLFLLAEMLKTSIAYLVHGKGKPPRSRLPKHGYRRDMMDRMRRLIATGMFDDLLPR